MWLKFRFDLELCHFLVLQLLVVLDLQHVLQQVVDHQEVPMEVRVEEVDVLLQRLSWPKVVHSDVEVVEQNRLQMVSSI